MTITNETNVQTKPTTSVVIVTPEIAERWLKLNVNNRPVSAVTVRKYQRDMEAGVWRFTNAGIAFDTNGHLIDGQHRLLAIMQLHASSGIAMNVTRNLPPEAKYYIDQGRKRTPGNQLAMSGVKNYNSVAASVRLYLIWADGLLHRDTKAQQLITAPQIQEWVERNPDLVELSNQSHRDLINNDARPAVIRAAFLAFAQIDPQDAASFVHRLSTGVSLSEGNPLLALRQRLEIDRRQKRTRTSRDQLGMIFKTWNAWRTGRSLKQVSPIKWDESNFPTPV